MGKSDFMLGLPLSSSASVVSRPKMISALETRRSNNDRDEKIWMSDSSCSRGVLQVVAAKYHSVAVTLGGEVLTWGHGRSGRLGHGDENPRPEPCSVVSLFRSLEHKKMVVMAAAGENHTMVLTDSGTVYAW